jgi:hypothetical protein
VKTRHAAGYAGSAGMFLGMAAAHHSTVYLLGTAVFTAAGVAHWLRNRIKRGN